MGRKVSSPFTEGGMGLGGGARSRRGIEEFSFGLGKRGCSWAQLGTQESGAGDLGVSND